ncbi:MAG TPA: hypothetical protein PKB06_07775 [Actinotalea sp.]|nr:hypothetical protein [Actinotalea sp.]
MTPHTDCGPADREDMDVTKEPGYAEAHARIARTYGALWAERFAVLAPLMFEDSEGPLAKAFLYGLDSKAAGSRPGEDVAWTACQAIVDEIASEVVREAEQLLGA